MGRGKKKGGKNPDDKKGETNPEDLPIGSLTVSDAPATTSQDAPDQEEGGLGLTGASRRQKKKKPETVSQDQDTSKPASGPPPSGPPPSGPPPSGPPPSGPPPSGPSPSGPPPTQTPAPKEEDEGGLGLGLEGGARKKRPRKKKDASLASQEATKQLPSQSGPASGAGDALGPPVTRKPVEEVKPSTSWASPPPGFDSTRDPPLGGGKTTSWRDRSSAAPVSAPAPTQFAPAPPKPSAQPYKETSQARGDLGSSRSDSSRQSMSSSSSKSTELCHYKIPSKIATPSPYVLSRPVRVLANYLRMSIKPLKIHRYDVTFKPERPKKMIPKAYYIAKSKMFPNITIAFDQMKNAYSLTPLPNISMNERKGIDVEVEDNNKRSITFEVSFKHTGVVDLQTIINYMKNGTSLSPPTEAIQCIDVILRQGTLETYVKAGRQFFKRPAQPIDLGHGLEMWTGLFQSAIFTTQPFINIDVAHKGFPRTQPLLQAFTKDFQLDPKLPLERQRSRNIEFFKQFIKGLRVMAAIGGDSSTKGQKREFIVNDIVDPPNKLKFTINEGTPKAAVMTVAQYFETEKKIRLNYPNLNCLWVGPRDKKIYYPMELLEVSHGQALNKQLNEFQLSTMVREAATKPDERKRKIEALIDSMHYSQNSYFKEFGLKIDDQFFPVQAKVLQAPKLNVGGSVVEPRKGVWQTNKLLLAKPLENWGFIALDLDYRGSNAEEIMKLMCKVGASMGMRISAPPKEHIFINVSVERLPRVFHEALDKGIKFLLIVVSGRGRDNYHIVKKSAERDVGILTQCIKEFTATRRLNEQTVKNILLKVNSKLMGINQALDINSVPRCLRNCPCMVVGADVTHPSPDQSSVPSIAAVTASIDSHCFKYNIQLCVQTPKMEVIVEFEEMMLEHLRVYRDANRVLPQKIFVFRDGVSEGQFAIVMNSELQAVHNAYKRIAGPTAKPEVLFMLVQKRHHTRFFVPNRSDNVDPGTVVDKDIVHARELDFYLVSHQAIKGTARPTRYHAVCNDGQIPDEEVEQLTYYLCHLYSRCTRAVSYPTPTYYAHLACLRARSLTHGEKFNNSDLEKKPQRLRVMEKILETSRMFFV